MAELYEGDVCAITVTGAQSQAGEGYVATATAVSNDNYKLPAAVTATWKIVPKSLSIDYWRASIGGSYVFTGARLYPVPVVTDDLLGA